VNLVSTAYQRFRLLIHEGSKFLVIGGIGFVVTIGGADILHFDVGLDKYTSITVATVVATVVTFIGNRYWTFAHREGKGASHETVMFFVLNGVGLLIQYACIGLIQDVMGLQGKLWYTVANLIGTAIGTVFRFWSYRRWVWHEQPPSEIGMAADAAGLLDDDGHESREPALVPPDPMFLRPAPAAQNGHDARQNGRGPEASGRGRPDGPRHARLR
jgi:putative flippase GtrA